MSKYQTRRQQRRSRIRNIIKRTILILVLAALTVVTSFYYVRYKSDKQASLSKGKTKLKGQPKMVLKDSPQILAENYTRPAKPIQNPTADSFKSIEPVATATELSEEKTMDNTEYLQPKPTTKEVYPAKKMVADSGKFNKPVAKEVNPLKEKAADTARFKQAAPSVEKVEMKQLSQQKMSEILNSIQSEKSKSKNRSNCIQIQKTSTSNVENAFAIAKYLNSNGFIISGRLTVPGTIEGIQIDAAGSCIKITIGSL